MKAYDENERKKRNDIDSYRKIDFKLYSWEKRKRFGPWPTLYSSSHSVGLLSYLQ